MDLFKKALAQEVKYVEGLENLTEDEAFEIAEALVSSSGFLSIIHNLLQKEAKKL